MQVSLDKTWEQKDLDYLMGTDAIKVQLCFIEKQLKMLKINFLVTRKIVLCTNTKNNILINFSK